MKSIAERNPEQVLTVHAKRLLHAMEADNGCKFRLSVTQVIQLNHLCHVHRAWQFTDEQVEALTSGEQDEIKHATQVLQCQPLTKLLGEIFNGDGA